MEKLSELELISVKKVYKSIIKFLEYFYETNVFNDLWFDLKNIEVSFREEELYEIAEKKYSKVSLALKKNILLLEKCQFMQI